MNHTAGLRIVKDEENRNWTINGGFHNMLVRLNTSVSILKNYTVKLENITAELPTKSENVTVVYQKRHGQEHQLKLYMRESERSKWNCNGTMKHNQSLLWTCNKHEVEYENIHFN